MIILIKYFMKGMLEDIKESWKNIFRIFFTLI